MLARDRTGHSRAIPLALSLAFSVYLARARHSPLQALAPRANPTRPRGTNHDLIRLILVMLFVRVDRIRSPVIDFAAGWNPSYPFNTPGSRFSRARFSDFALEMLMKTWFVKGCIRK